MKRSVACILFHNGKVLVGRRIPGGQMGECWEFPGGKVENGESAEVAICREFDEEFSVPVTVGPKIAQAVFQYNGKDIQLEGYEIFLATDNPQWILTEHTEIRWVTFDEIKELHFVDSDLLIYPQVVEYFDKKEVQ